MGFPNLHSALMFLLGLQPIHEQRKFSWWRKVRWIGLLIFLVQLSLTFYGYYKETSRHIIIARNNILLGLAIIKRIVALLLPILVVLGKVIHFRSMENFWKQIGMFDRALKEQVESAGFESINRKIWRSRQLHAGVTVSVKSMEIVYGILMTHSLGGAAPWWAVHLHNYYTCVLLTITADLWAKCSAIELRQDLLLQFIKRIQDEKWGAIDLEIHRKELLNRYVRDKSEGGS